MQYDKELDIPASYMISISNNFAMRILLKILNILDRFIPSFNSRYYKELLFDIYSSKFIDKNKDKIIFCTRPLFPYVLKKAKKLGIKTCIQASVLHPLFNFSLVKNEAIKYNLKSKDSYTNLKRAIRLSKAILETEWLMVHESSNKKFVSETYSNYVNPRKIIKIKSYYAVDKKLANEKYHFQKNSNTPISFIHISHINLIKGLSYLFEAWEMLMRNQKCDCKLILVGKVDINIKKIFRKFFYNLPNIEFKGYLKNLDSIYECADVFLCPSLSEAGPTTILEALSNGLPVICSNNCGFSSLIINGYNGFTYHFNDVNKLAEIIVWCSKNRNKIRDMGLNAKKSVENLSLEKYTNEVVKKLRDKKKRRKFISRKIYK
ncbi:MAG: glycosyltransferase family 4 protein [Candidatus Helarchaeota archaeon]